MNSLKTHKFVKENGVWSIVLPNWPGHKGALAMVAGADTLLDKLSKDTEEITLTFSEQVFDNWDFSATRVRKYSFGAGGSDYVVDNGVNDHTAHLHGHEFWLCPVTVYVFNKYPKTLYVQVHETALEKTED